MPPVGKAAQFEPSQLFAMTLFGCKCACALLTQGSWSCFSTDGARGKKLESVYDAHV